MNYSFQREEDKIVKKWRSASPFLIRFTKEELNKAKLIMMAPPNMTGAVHLGHIWDLAIPDFYNRFFCLENRKGSIFIPGKDHAGIATQAKIEKALRDKNVDVKKMSREEKVKFAENWVKKFSSQAENTWSTFGMSQNMNFHKYTKDKDIEDKVLKLFIDYFNKGLIYQGNKIVNWDTGLQTAISNEEVEWKISNSELYYIKYKVKDSKEFLVVATTRPETIFSDVAVFINPKDERYQHLNGKTLINPLNGELLPILKDNYVDISFGTGVLKCTPHHDANDFALYKKHKLKLGDPSIDFYGNLNKKANEFKGLTIKEGRKKIVAYLALKKLLLKTEEIKNELPKSSRSGSSIEPLISKQWFFKTTSFCKKSFNTFLKNGNFEPNYFNDKLSRWGEDLEDWCISRQLWWGTRIPLYFDKNNKYVAALKNPDPKIYQQVDDVFDTWFTSGHWPYLLKTSFNIDENKVFETSAMGTDIFFFWAVRMILTSHTSENTIPFKNCLLHGLLRDNIGRKMSKSLDNGVDPIEEVKKESADSIRWALLSRNTYGNDINYSKNLLQEGKSLVIKINNAFNFLLTQKNSDDIKDTKTKKEDKKEIINAIKSSVNELISDLNSLVEKHLINVYCKKLRLFFFNNFCGRYIELMKKYHFNENEKIEIIKEFLRAVLLLSPVMPFFTSYIFEQAKEKFQIEEKTISVKYKKDFKKNKIIDVAFFLIDKYKELSTNQKVFFIDFEIKNKNEEKITKNIVETFLSNKLDTTKTNQKKIQVIEEFKNEKITFTFFVEENLKEKEKRILFLEGEIKRSLKMLENERFVSKAPKDLIEKERKKLVKFQEELKLLNQN